MKKFLESPSGRSFLRAVRVIVAFGLAYGIEYLLNIKIPLIKNPTIQLALVTGLLTGLNKYLREKGMIGGF